jgi:hypothetical protein
MCWVNESGHQRPDGAIYIASAVEAIPRGMHADISAPVLRFGQQDFGVCIDAKGRSASSSGVIARIAGCDSGSLRDSVSAGGWTGP